MESLFRKEAVEHATRRLTGDVHVKQPRYLSYFTLFLTALILFGTVVLVNWRYNRTVTVSGVLEPNTGLLRLRTSVAGTVISLNTKGNEDVSAGSVLAAVAVENPSSLSYNGMTSVDQYTEQRAALGREERLELSSLNEQVQLARSALNRLVQERSFLQDRSAANVEQAERARIDLERNTRLLESRLVTRDQLDTAITRASEINKDAIEIELETSKLDRQIIEARSLLSTLDKESKLIVETKTRERLGLDRQAISDSREGTLVIKAPVDGRLLSLSVSEGEAVRAGESIVTMQPTGSKIIARLILPSNSVGFIMTGQTVRLRYDAFPYQTFGTYEGKITNVSNSVYLPEDLENYTGMNDAAAFLAEVELSNEFIRAYGRDIKLKPGLTLEATIVIGDRSLIEVILEPIYALRG